jgi:tetratricopeptide (TPR) repeat protein
MRALALALAVLLAAPARADVPITREAQLEFERGVQLLHDAEGPRYAEAYEAFRSAYAASPTPKILGNLGLCAMQLERDGEAIEHYERYLREVPDADAAELERIRRDLVALQERSATLVLEIDPLGATIDDRRHVDAAAIENRYRASGRVTTLRVRAGRREIEVTAPDHLPARVAIDLAAGRTERRTVLLEPAGGISTPSIVFLAATGALAVATAVVGGIALDRHAAYDAFETGGSRAEAEDARAEGEALNTATDVLLAGTIVAGSFALGFLVRDAVLGSRGGDVTVAPTLSPWHAGVVLVIR